MGEVVAAVATMLVTVVGATTKVVTVVVVVMVTIRPAIHCFIRALIVFSAGGY